MYRVFSLLALVTSTIAAVITSGYLQVDQVKGTKVVEPNGQQVILRGTNLGGWLVFEDWMCGFTDTTSNNDREPQVTLESRFGLVDTKALIDIWQNNWITSADFDMMRSLGFNLVRLPFSYRNFKWSNGSYIMDLNGNVDFSRLDWAVAQAKSRGIYVILDFHVWEGQVGQGSSNYSIIS
jgi:aryl-phospho-beta-D-glucosidase BglC (GH1 family)